MHKKRRKKNNGKKFVIIGIAAAVLIALLIIGLVITSGDDSVIVKVHSVNTICTTGTISGVSNVYSGVVESQEVVNVNANSSYKIDVTYVKAGDSVKKGDRLFAYDMSENAMDTKRAELELSKLRTNSQIINEQISQLLEQLEEASDSQKSDINIQLLEAQSNLRQNQYDIEAKQLEISNLQEDAANAVVTAPISGVIQEVNKDISSESSSKAYISILATGDYRIEGLINEQNIEEIKLGDKMAIHPRNREGVWYGTISEIDTENPVEKNNTSTAQSGSSNYNFYITLTTAKGLMLGQHVYCEKDLGLTPDGKIKLPVYYVVNAESSRPYVWAEENGTIQKHTVKLGEKDEDTNTFIIESGLSLEDYIAYPDTTVKAGRKTEVVN